MKKQPTIEWAKMPLVGDLREIPRKLFESIDPYTDWAKVDGGTKFTEMPFQAKPGHAIVYQGKRGQVFLMSQGWTNHV